jgi:hypothetical protein
MLYRDLGILPGRARKARRTLDQAAVHEAGHSLLAAIGETGVAEASLDPYGAMGRYVTLKKPATLRDLPAIVGGVAAERAMYGSDGRDLGGDFSNAYSDRAVARRLIGTPRTPFSDLADSARAFFRPEPVLDAVEGLARLLQKHGTLPGWAIDEWLQQRRLDGKFIRKGRDLSTDILYALKSHKDTAAAFSNNKCVQWQDDTRGPCAICGDFLRFRDRPAVCIYRDGDSLPYGERQLLCDRCAARHAPGLFSNVCLCLNSRKGYQ